jgi:outer membrane protein
MLSLVLLVMLVWSAAAAAQTTLTLKQAIDRAMLQNNSIRQALAASQSLDISAKQARNNYLPEVNASAGWNAQAGGRTNTSYGHSADAGITANVTLFDGFSKASILRGAKSSYLAGLSTYEATQQNVMLTVFNYFLQVQLDSELVRIQTENLAAEQKLLEQIDAFAKAGQKALSDVLTQKATTAKSELDVVNARLNYDVAKLNLLKLIGDDSLNTSSLVIGRLPLDSSDVRLSLLSDTSLSATLLNRKDIAAQQQSINAAYSSIEAAKSSYWPSVSLSTGISTGYSDHSTGTMSNQVFDNNPAASLGVSLSIPIFSRFSTKNAITTARIKATQEEDNLRELKRTVVFEVKQALLSYNAADEQIRVAHIEVESAKQSLDAAQARYEVGAATLTDLTLARSVYLSAQNDLIQAQATRVLRTAGVGYYCGAISGIMKLYSGSDIQ